MVIDLQMLIKYMKYICTWFFNNWLTIVSIILSGYISLKISAYYYRKENRSQLQMTVILPIINLLKEYYSLNNYNELVNLSKNFYVRYLKKDEKKLLSQIIICYKEISKYSEIDRNANILFSYYIYVLKLNNVDIYPYPIEYHNEIVAFDYPPNFQDYLIEDLQEVLKNYDPDFEPKECTECLVSLFSNYSRKYFSKTKLQYFNDHNLEDVLIQSDIKKKWDSKLNAFNQIKDQFLNLNIVKDLVDNSIKGKIKI